MSLFVPTASWHSEEHHMQAESARRFFAEHLTPNIAVWEKKGQVDKAFWAQVGKQGFMAGSVDEAYGGLGGNKGFDAVTLYEQAYAGDISWGYAISPL